MELTEYEFATTDIVSLEAAGCEAERVTHGRSSLRTFRNVPDRSEVACKT